MSETKGRCSVKYCSNVSGVRFFRFPSSDDPQRVLQWKLACSDATILRKEPPVLHAGNRICSDHFKPYLMTGRCLNKTAVPTLNLFKRPKSFDIGSQTDGIGIDKGTQTCSTIMVNCNVQTSQDISAGTPRKRKLRSIVKEKSKTIRKLFKEKKNLEGEIKSLEEVNMMSKKVFKNACEYHLPTALGNLAKIVCELLKMEPR